MTTWFFMYSLCVPMRSLFVPMMQKKLSSGMFVVAIRTSQGVFSALGTRYVYTFIIYQSYKAI